jgi:rSAM/selenodomain-associated transferase 2
MTAISAIIPTIDEADRIGALIEALRRDGFRDIIVADGGSTDETVRIAADRGAQVVSTTRGRGVQLAAGARAATGEHLFFLHADSVPPEDAHGLIARTLSHAEVAGGSFCLAFDEGHPLLSFYAMMSRINHALFTYGDQGLFLRRRVFDRIGGYAALPLFEDVEILGRLRRAGRFVKLQTPMTTSARRFRRDGVARRELASIALVGLYHLGVPAARLERWYRPERAHRQ